MCVSVVHIWIQYTHTHIYTHTGALLDVGLNVSFKALSLSTQAESFSEVTCVLGEALGSGQLDGRAIQLSLLCV